MMSLDCEERDPEDFAAGWRRESQYQVTCLSSKQNVYGLLFANNNTRLEEDKLKCICSGMCVADMMMLCPLDQDNSDEVCDNLDIEKETCVCEKKKFVRKIFA